uniref:NADH-ubiquinone oxidoreductase chain 3 n=1 Tax=Metacrangonyx sp. 1 MDMBR-2012 TaxID=1200660 RepID=K7ZW23_9CRUS|nr:NADH dehydrogenase subunit 3 [Metacrangonyx sp. 1 MDMBR-2012]
MYILASLMMVLFILSFIIYMFAVILGKKMEKERSKNSSFECGFEPFKKARTPFSTRFFLVSVIFLIFDIEIVILMPVGIMMNFFVESYFSIVAALITFILLLGLAHEWNQGALEWVQ